jgi:hypothetical protein
MMGTSLPIRFTPYGDSLTYIQTCKILIIGSMKGEPQKDKLTVKVVLTRLSAMAQFKQVIVHGITSFVSLPTNLKSKWLLIRDLNYSKTM